MDAEIKMAFFLVTLGADFNQRGFFFFLFLFTAPFLKRKRTAQREIGAAPRTNGPDWQCIKLPLSLHLAFCNPFIN